LAVAVAAYKKMKSQGKKMSKKPKYAQHEAEILEMYKNGKTAGEILKYLNKNYNSKGSESSLRSFISRKMSNQNEEKTVKEVPAKEKEQLPLFPEQPFKEVTEKITALTEEMEKNYSKQKETAVLQEQKMSKAAAIHEQKMSEAAASQEEALSNVRKLEAKYNDVTERHCILNETLHETIIMKREDNKKETTRYLIIGVIILGLALALTAGYHSSHYDDKISFHYMVIVAYVLAGAFVGFGVGVIKKKIMEKMQKTKSR